MVHPQQIEQTSYEQDQDHVSGNPVAERVLRRSGMTVARLYNVKREYSKRSKLRKKEGPGTRME